MTVARRLATWGLELRLEDVPAAVVHAVRRHLLDGLGCAFGAVRTGAAPSAMAWADLATAPEQASAIGLGVRRPTHVAAGVNGHLVHALDFDDTHAGGLVHATSVVLPAALAVGEEVGASVEDVVTAAIVGYEVVCRIAAAAPHGFHRRGLHATSACGVFAAALVAARLRGLDADTAVDALGIAGSLAGGSLEFLTTGSSTKSLHPGFASANAVLAATLAAAGADGPDSILEGGHGLYRALADLDVAPEAVLDGLGTRWEATRITVKPYPACQLVHAPLDALRTLDIDPTEVVGVEVTIPPDSVEIVAEPVAAKRRPRSDYEAKFSLAWCVATVLVDGDLTIDAFDPARRDRPDVLALADRVTHVVVDPGVPAADAPGRVRVTTTDGQVHQGTVAASRGGPANPLSDADVVAKFTATAGDDAVASAGGLVAVLLADVLPAMSSPAPATAPSTAPSIRIH